MVSSGAYPRGPPRAAALLGYAFLRELGFLLACETAPRLGSHNSHPDSSRFHPKIARKTATSSAFVVNITNPDCLPLPSKNSRTTGATCARQPTFASPTCGMDPQ